MSGVAREYAAIVRRVIASTGCIALLAAPVSAQDAGARRLPLDTAALSAALAEEMRATRAPGAAIAVVSGDRIIYARGIGVANIETGEPVTPETLFRIGSATKMFTGLTALLLAADARVRFDAPIAGYTKGLDPTLGRITLHQLLTHTGGVINEGAASGPHDDRALGERVRAWTSAHTFAPPGDVYSYTGPGYWLAGYAIEQAGGGWYADLVTARVLAPLGMRRSTFRPTMAMTWPLALDHRVDSAGPVLLRPYPDDASTWPSGALFSSVSELARFAIALMNDGRIDGEQVIPRNTVVAMSTVQAPTPGDEAGCGYSYGLAVCTRDGVRTLSHYGFRVGSGAVMTMAPDQRFAVIILANRNGGIFGRTERRAMELMLPLLPAPRDVPAVAAASSDPDARRRVVGTYVNGADTLRLVERGDSLFYRYRTAEQRTRLGAREEILVLDGTGRPVQRFMIVRGRSGGVYLHDGSNAFLRIVR